MMLQVQNIIKSYAQHRAVDGISFSIDKGVFYGLLGPNGAGKTTTIQMISGIMPPDAGSILVGGHSVYPQSGQIKKHLGIVPQEIALYGELSALDNLLFWGGLYAVHGRQADQRAKELLVWVGLDGRMHDKVRTYSGGMQRRVNIAAALMHDPDLIIMDEPTVGVDPQSRNKIYELLDDLHKRGKTILYTTHYMEEAEKMCSVIGIIDKGRIIAEGSLDDLKMQYAKEETVVVRYSNGNLHSKPAKAFELIEDEQKIIYRMPEVRKQLHTIIQELETLQIGVEHIDIQQAGLESIFLQLTGRQLRD